MIFLRFNCAPYAFSQFGTLCGFAKVGNLSSFEKERTMTIRHLCVSMLMGSWILLFADGAVQAQLGSGSGSGGAIGQGSPEITKPENDGDRERHDGSGTIQHGQDPSERIGPEGALIMKPKPGEKGTPGSGRPPDRSASHPGTGSAGGSSSDKGSGSSSTGLPGDSSGGNGK